MLASTFGSGTIYDISFYNDSLFICSDSSITIISNVSKSSPNRTTVNLSNNCNSCYSIAISNIGYSPSNSTTYFAVIFIGYPSVIQAFQLGSSVSSVSVSIQTQIYKILIDPVVEFQYYFLSYDSNNYIATLNQISCTTFNCSIPVPLSPNIAATSGYLDMVFFNTSTLIIATDSVYMFNLIDNKYVPILLNQFPMAVKVRNSLIIIELMDSSYMIIDGSTLVSRPIPIPYQLSLSSFDVIESLNPNVMKIYSSSSNLMDLYIVTWNVTNFFDENSVYTAPESASN